MHRGGRGRPTNPSDVTPRGLCVAAIAAAAFAATGCTGDREPITIGVEPSASIQDAVDRARPGDLVLIEPGVYNESVEVTTRDIVIRGVDRNSVVLDGETDLENGIVVRSNGVAIENLTVRGFRGNGVLFVGELDQRGASGDSYGAAGESVQLRGYRASYVTAHDNGLYGLYAFAAQQGVFEHSYTAGHPDAGVYIGQCQPCDAVVTDVVSERNTIGYQAINASGVAVVSSTWTGNRMGIEVGSQDAERLAPQIGHHIVGNVVTDNVNAAAPGTPESAFGLGIVISGGQENVIERNLVTGHSLAGIAVTDVDTYAPRANQVRGNVLSDNGVDLVYVISTPNRGGESPSDCFEDNRADTADPPSLLVGSCVGQTPASDPLVGPPGPKTVTFSVQRVAPQPSRPGDPRGPWTSAGEIDTTLDLEQIELPEQ
jgi:hypothetical protein